MTRRLTLGQVQVYLEPRDAWAGVYVARDAFAVEPARARRGVR